MRRMTVVVALVLALPGVASAGGGGDISQCPGFAQGTTISMLDSCFDGIAHFAPAGTALTVRNDGALPHTYTAVDGSFDSGQLQPGETFTLTVDQPGVVQVFCALHGTAEGEGMAGTLMIGEAIPPPVGSSVDLSGIEAAVAADREAVMEALDRQFLAISNLSAAQASLRDGLENVAPAQPGGSEPVVVTVEGGRDDAWVPLVSGLGAGLAAGALLLALSRRREGPTMEPALEEPAGGRILTGV